MSHYFPMHEGYRCPLCPNHDDDEFCWDPLLSSPICTGCSHEIINLVCDAMRIDDRALDQLELVTGLTYEELQVAVLEPEISRMEKILSSRSLSEKPQNTDGMTLDEWIDTERERLSRFKRLVASAKAKIRAHKKVVVAKPPESPS